MKTNHKKTIQSAKLSLSKMATDIKDPAAIIGGMVLGKLASDVLDKAITTGGTVAGLKGLKGFDSVKSFIKPAILIGGGLAAKQLLKNPLLKNVGIGVAAYGGAVAVQSVVNIPQLSNFNPATTPTNPVAGLGYIPRRPMLPTRTIGALPVRPAYPAASAPAQPRRIL